MPLRIYMLCVLLCAFTLNSCNDDDEEPARVHNTTALADPLLKELKQEPQLYNDWQEFYTQRMQTFSIDSFVQQETVSDELFSRTAELPASFYELYGPLLVYNKDSSLFVDAFSYSLIVENKEGKLLARGGEADQEIAVVNPASKERKRIFFCGPTCTVAKAVWIDEKNVALFGLSSDDGIEGHKPMIWIVDIANGNTNAYSYLGHAESVSPESLLKHMISQQGIEMEY